MQSIGGLLIEMALNTAAFANDLGKSNTLITSWEATHNRACAGVVNAWRGVQKEIEHTVEEVFSLKTAMLALVGGGAIGEVIKSSLESANAMVHHADAIGITTDTLQQYQYVAKLAGVSADELTGNFEKFGKAVGQAQAGTGALYTYLSKTNLGLLAQIQHADTLDEALNALFHTMGNLDTQQAKLALSAAAFGKGGLEMVNMVHNGTDEMEALKQKAVDLGIVISGDLLRSAHEAQEKLETLGMILKSRTLIAVTQNSEAIGHLADAMIDALPAMAKFTAAITEQLTSLIDWDKHTLEVQRDMITLSGYAGEAALRVSSIFKGGANEDDIKKWEDATTGALKRVDDQLKNLHNGAQKPTGAVNALDDIFRSDSNKINSRGMAADIQAQSDAAAKADEEYKKLEADAKKTFESTRTPMEKYSEGIVKLNKELAEGLIDQDTYDRAVVKLGESMDKAENKGSLFFDVMKAGIHGQITDWKSLGKVVLEYAQNVLTAMASGQGGGAGGMSLFGAAGGALGGLSSLFGFGQSSSFVGPAQQSMFSQAGTYLSSFFHSGGVVGSSGGTSRRVNASVFNNAPRFHSGGVVGGEVPAILQKGERVLTEAQQKSMPGGGHTYYIDARGADKGVEERLTNMISSLNSSLESRAVTAMVSARARNPLIFKAG